MDNSQCYTTCEDSAMPVSSSTVEEGARGGEETEGKTSTPSFVSRIEYEVLQKAFNGAKKQIRKLNEELRALQEQLNKSNEANALLEDQNIELKLKERELITKILMLEEFSEEKKREMSAVEEKMTNVEQILKEDRKWKETFEKRERKWKEEVQQDIQRLSDKIPGNFQPNKRGNRQTCVINIESNSRKTKNSVKKK